MHLSHETGEKSAKTVPSTDGLLVVDYAQNGKPIGVESPDGKTVLIHRTTDSNDLMLIKNFR